jgi:hypothetical protein
VKVDQAGRDPAGAGSVVDDLGMLQAIGPQPGNPDGRGRAVGGDVGGEGDRVDRG